jgi:hypothetical protein
MAERKGLSKKIRFEVFKRDSFTCQYCGKSAPEVVLEVDHIKPVSKDGENDIVNLITACKACNAGKSDRELSDDTVMAKRKAQLDELQERREQIEMMMEWQGELDNIRDQELNSLVDYVNSKMRGFGINEKGKKDFRVALRKYGLSEMLECTSISADQYIVIGKGDKEYDLSLDKFISYIPKIAASRKSMREKPYLMDLYYINGVLRKIHGRQISGAVTLLEKAYLKGISVYELKSIALDKQSIAAWINSMEALING